MDARTVIRDAQGNLVIRVQPGAAQTPWSQFGLNGANAAASAQQAAGGPGVYNVATLLVVEFASGSTAPTVPATPLSFYIRDGAVGAGTIIFRQYWSLPATAGAVDRSVIPLYLVGSANTPMSFEFLACGANVFSSWYFQGFSTQQP